MSARKFLLCLIAAALTTGTLPNIASADEVAPLLDCYGPAGDPNPQTQPLEWILRDLINISCATQRQQDELASPAFLSKWMSASADYTATTPELIADQLAEPTRPRGFLYPFPQRKATDPFRVPEEWQAAGRGQTQRFSYIASTGAKVIARLYTPNHKPGERPLPGVVVTPGIFSFNETHTWLGEDLAEAGYMVLVVDPQGQGDSEILPHNPDGSFNCSSQRCPGFTTDDVSDMRSSVDFLVSTPSAPLASAQGINAAGTPHFNPLWKRLDRSKIGVAAHSLGAIAISKAGQLDDRVKALVAYDDLDRPMDPENLAKAHAPTLWFAVDYDFPSLLIPRLPTAPPNPQRHWVNFSELKQAGVDSMTVTPRASTHYEWSYQPFPATLPASRYGERTSLYYTRAWFDRYVKGDITATKRLTATTFDDSADVSSIGRGIYDPDIGNSPYKIGGKCVANLLSFYYASAYWLDGGAIRSPDIRASGCPGR